MKNATLERWIWVLLYGGAFAAIVGLWAMGRDARLGWVLVGFGLAGVAFGAAGIVWRARLDRKPGTATR